MNEAIKKYPKIIRAEGLTEYDGMPIVDIPIHKALKGYRTRLCLVYGRMWFRVPEFIYRYDSGNSNHRARGWVVKSSKHKEMPAASFLDSKYGTKETLAVAKAGYALAQAYLAEHLPYDPVRYDSRDQVDLNPELFYAKGAHRLVTQMARGCRFPQYFFEITGVNGYPLKRIYIGSSRNITQARIDEKFSLCKRYRAKIVKLSAAGYFDDAMRVQFEFEKQSKPQLTYEQFILKFKP